MTRPRSPHYVGATGRIQRAALGELDARWALQPKVDGIYAEATTDAGGWITKVVTRTGREWKTDLVGVQTALPCSVICGELTASTEWGMQRRDEQGFDSMHLFDIVVANTRCLRDEPYRQRRDRLMMAQDRARRVAERAPWSEDPSGNAHDLDTGRFVRRIPAAWERLPVVRQYLPRQAESAWADEVWSGHAEGLVAVRLDAKVGQRSSKRKCKAPTTIDALVLSTDARVAVLRCSSGVFTVSARGSFTPLPGTWVEVAVEGRYINGNPRFARLVRPRPDMAAA